MNEIIHSIAIVAYQVHWREQRPAPFGRSLPVSCWYTYSHNARLDVHKTEACRHGDAPYDSFSSPFHSFIHCDAERHASPDSEPAAGEEYGGGAGSRLIFLLCQKLNASPIRMPQNIVVNI